MEKKWKRGSLLLATILLASSASAEGGPYLQKQQKQQKPAVAMNPSANAMVMGGADLTLQGNYLYMVANQDGMFYAYDADCANATDVKGAKGGREYFMGSKASSGFKVALGAFFDHDQWSSQIKYQWINPQQKSHIGDETVIAGSDPIMLKKWTGQIKHDPGFQEVGAVNSIWELNHQSIDWMLGRNFHVSEYLKLCPFAGLKGTWQSQKLQSTGTHIDSTSSETPEYYSNLEEFKVGGVGLMGGLDADWCLSKHWSIYTNICGAAMWASYYDSKHQAFDTEYVNADFLVTDPTDSAKYTLNINDDNAEGSKNNMFNKDRRFSICPVFTTELGLKWETFFSDDAYHFEIAVGWEEQCYVNFARFINKPARDLTLHGLNLKVNFGF